MKQAGDVFLKSALSYLLAIFLLAGVSTAQQLYYLRGSVSDISSGDSLSAANIRILGSSRGTMTNSVGFYSLRIETGSQIVVYSYLGYEPDTLRIDSDRDTVYHARLRPSPLQFPEVVVLAEDPALEIIRKAIANKRLWMQKLKSYSFEAFTRQVLRRDTAIASIMEAYSSGFMATGDTLREIVKQKRQTENIPMEGNLAAVRRVVNFNEDEIRLLTARVQNRPTAFTFVGATAPNALEYYDYKLLSTARVSGLEVYRIAMSPKTRLRPLFKGTITIADGTFAVMGVDLEPNEALAFPFTKDIVLRYRQEFALYDSIFWMPTNVRITGGVSVSFIGMSMPRIGIDIASTLTDYAINITIPDSIRQKPRLSVDSSAVVYDSTFWSENEVLPLTNEEATAYRTLDSTQTLAKQFAPRGPLVTMGSGSGLGFLKYFDGRFNRVEAVFLGGKIDIDSATSFLDLHARAGIGFGDKRFKGEVGATLYPISTRKVGVHAEVYRRLDLISDGGFYGPLHNSLTGLLYKNDYSDYFLTNGWRISVIGKPIKMVRSELSYINEQHSTLFAVTDYSLFNRNATYRPNPPIADGMMRSLRLDVRLGEPRVAFDLIIPDAVDVSVEHSTPSFLKSDFRFTRYSGTLTYSVETFGKDMFFAPVLRIRLTGGGGSGTLPPQRNFIVESRSSGFAPFGVLRGAREREFSGDRFAMLAVEHNFRSLPFLALNIPFLYRNNIEMIIHGAAAQSWGGLTTTRGWYYEAGIGISRIFDVFRMDLSYRFNDPARFYFTIAVASIF